MWASSVGAVVLLAFATIASAYGGMVNPDLFPPASLVAMAYPFVVIIALVVTALLAMLRNRLGWVTGVAILFTFPVLIDYSPLNFNRPLDAEETARSFTFMTFNSLHWDDYDRHDPPIVPNPSLQCVIDNDPDILCVQESMPTGVSVNKGITPAQRDTIDRRYPYRIIDRLFPGLALYSKYPVTRVVLQDSICGTAVLAAYRISLHGRLLTVYNVHLQSLLLTPEDKALYRSVTDVKGSAHDVMKMRDHIFSKLYSAFQLRAVQARYIRDLLDHRHGNVIVCGDFNDVPDCYAIRTIRGNDLHDAYSETALGPTITYGKNRFYFRIDHILYRGDFEARSIKRGRETVSDHYPLITTFVWKDDE